MSDDESSVKPLRKRLRKRCEREDYVESTSSSSDGALRHYQWRKATQSINEDQSSDLSGSNNKDYESNSFIARDDEEVDAEPDKHKRALQAQSILDSDNSAIESAAAAENRVDELHEKTRETNEEDRLYERLMGGEDENEDDEDGDVKRLQMAMLDGLQRVTPDIFLAELTRVYGGMFGSFGRDTSQRWCTIRLAARSELWDVVEKDADESCVEQECFFCCTKKQTSFDVVLSRGKQRVVGRAGALCARRYESLCQLGRMETAFVCALGGKLSATTRKELLQKLANLRQNALSLIEFARAMAARHAR